MLIGYARVSTMDQNIVLQTQALQKAGCEKIYQDVISGKTKQREGLDKALEHLRKGDTLMVWKLDRLGRSTRHLIIFVGELADRGIDFISLTESIDTKTPIGRFFFNVMASLAEMERELNHERTMAGLAAAKRLGRVGGRKAAMTSDKVAIAEALLQKYPVAFVAKQIKVSTATLYRYISKNA
ncbi:recombinase family protein [Methylotenera sp.]|uniref:recombinase family protein n=1 Tax=Methylotenera sp. TaxID=2051956 RepID=UPI002489DE82|nr:recombinase family protein [Methylotenera sp.]MDI1298634.1 recombinase family protein [Methylotenera sp.]